MSDNNVNYSNNNLAGGGFTEYAVNEGLISNEDGTHTPRTPSNAAGNYISPADMFSNTFTGSQRVADYDGQTVAIWEKLTNEGRTYVGYDGLYRVEFLPGRHKEALAWKSQYINTTNDKSFKEDEKPSGLITYTLSKEMSEPYIQALNIDVDSLKQQYNDSTDLSDTFTEMSHIIPTDVSLYLMTESIDKLQKDNQAKLDYKLFSDDVTNYVDRYFGGEYTGTDVGFYIDKGGRIRASYDSFMVYRGKQLVDDLITYSNGDNTLYAVGYMENTQTIQFVISKPLSDKLIKEFKSYTTLACRWNNPEIVPANFNPGEHVVFEQIINIQSGELLDADTIFGFDAVNIESKKTLADTL